MSPDDGITLIDAALGLGKTHALSSIINNSLLDPGKQYIIAFPTKKLSKEFNQKINNIGFFVQGRCEENCKQFDKLSKIYSLSLSANNALCANCDNRDKCIFHAVIETSKKEPLIITTHPMALWLADRSKKKVVVIFDESPASVLSNTVKANCEQIGKLYDIVGMPDDMRLISMAADKAKKIHESIKEKNNLSYNHITVFVSQITKSKQDKYIFFEPVGGHNFTPINNKGEFDIYFRHGLLFKELAIKAGIFKVDYIVNKDGCRQESGCHLVHEEALKKGVSRAAMIMLDLNNKFDINYYVYYGKDDEIKCECMRSVPAQINHPVIVLNGTPVEHEIKYNHVHKYDIEPKWFKTVLLKSLLGSGATKTDAGIAIYKEELRKAIKYCEGHILCVCKKAIVEELQEEFNNIEFVNYGGLRGLNTYKHCDSVVLLGNHRVSYPDAVKMSMCQMGGEWTWEKFVSWYDDFERAEYKQAISRVRPLDKPYQKNLVCCLRQWPVKNRLPEICKGYKYGGAERKELYITAGIKAVKKAGVKGLSKSEIMVEINKKLDGVRWKKLKLNFKDNEIVLVNMKWVFLHR